MMRRKAQVFVIGCLIVTFTSLYIYNSYSSYVIPVPLYNLYRSTNESLLRNVDLLPNSSVGDRHLFKISKIGRTLTKVERSEVGGTESMQTPRLELNVNASGNLSQVAVKEVSWTFGANLAVRKSNRTTDRIETNLNGGHILKDNGIPVKKPESSSANDVVPGERPEAAPGTVAVTNGSAQASVRSQLWATLGATANCAPLKQNLAFIKTHKTGSTTLGHLINRFGYHRRLSFVLNKHSRNNGHLVYYNVTKDSPKLTFLPPIGVRVRDYNNYKYNLIAIHVRYSRRAMDSFMKPNTKYVTIIRDPGSQFESAFSHFQFDDAFPLVERRKLNTTKEKLEHFFLKPLLYRDRLQLLPWEKTTGLRWYYARNNQAFDLGLDHKYHMNTNMVEKFIDRLEREMAVVLLTEYLDESLLVLRKKMCWTWSDILYIAKNRRPDVEALSDLLREKMRSWNAVDTMLYTHFNRTLWKQVEEYGPDFQNDLALFKKMLGQVFTECVSNQYQKSQGRNFHWVEYKPRQDSSKECRILVETKRALFKKIWARQDIMRSMLLSERNKSGGGVAGQARRMKHGYYYTRKKLDASRQRVYDNGGYPPGTNRSVDAQRKTQTVHQTIRVQPHTRPQALRQMRERP